MTIRINQRPVAAAESSTVSRKRLPEPVAAPPGEDPQLSHFSGIPADKRSKGARGAAKSAEVPSEGAAGETASANELSQEFTRRLGYSTPLLKSVFAEALRTLPLLK